MLASQKQQLYELCYKAWHLKGKKIQNSSKKLEARVAMCSNKRLFAHKSKCSKSPALERKGNGMGQSQPGR